MRTLLVGLDAACWPYLEPLLQAGEMPTFEGLMRRAAWGTLHSTMPPWTPTAWATLVTGKNPGKHGVFDMLWRRPGSYDFSPTSASVRSGTPLWKYLNERGVRVGLMNVAFAYPAPQVDGFAVSGFGAPEGAPDFVQPAELASSPLFAGYRPTVPADILRSAPPGEVLQVEKEHQSRQVESAAELAGRYQVDVLIINLMLTDHANHKMPEMALVREAYRHADADLDTLLRSFAPDNVLLISDHGSSRVQGEFLLNAWLQDKGYVVAAAREPADQAHVLNWILGQYLRETRAWNGSAEKAARALLRSAIPRLPAPAQERFWRRIETVLPRARRHMQFASEPDPVRSAVIPGSAFSGLIYLNIAGREPQGWVQPSQRDGLLDELTNQLAQIVEPESGQPLFSNIYRPEEIYHGAAAPLAPDLILDAYDKPWNIRTRHARPVAGRIRHGYFVDAVHGRDYGWHSKEGIFLCAGEAFHAGQQPFDLQLADIPAILLHLYDVPIPADYDGQVVLELFRPPYADRPPREQEGDAPGEPAGEAAAYSGQETDVLLRHLQALGYLD